MVKFNSIKSTIVNADWKSFYFLTIGALVASEFNLTTTFYCAIGAAIGFVLLNAIDPRN